MIKQNRMKMLTRGIFVLACCTLVFSVFEGCFLPDRGDLGKRGRKEDLFE